MAGGSARAVFQFLRGLAAGEAARDTPDGQLLARFVEQRDEAAFATLMGRHGPMVLGVCARVLRDPHDAEDAFQATFLVLARRAGSVARPHLLGPWLHGVARRTALKARTGAARRRRHERQAVRPEAVAVNARPDWEDLRPVLDEELSRLPARYGVPLVLCDLEGRTHEEVARQLGCARGTVTTRLTRARERLRLRLTRRGLVLSAGAVATLTGQLAPAAVPSALAGLTLRAVVLVPAGPAAVAGVVSAQVVSLTEGVLRAMFYAKLKTAAAAALVLATVAAGAGWGSHLLLAQVPAANRSGGQAQPGAGGLGGGGAGPGVEAATVLTELRKRKLELATKGYDSCRKEFEAGRVTADELYEWSKRLLAAQRERNATPREEAAAFQAHAGRMKELEGMLTAKFEAGRLSFTDATFGEYVRAEADLWLAEFNARTAKPRGGS